MYAAPEEELLPSTAAAAIHLSRSWAGPPKKSLGPPRNSTTIPCTALSPTSAMRARSRPGAAASTVSSWRWVEHAGWVVFEDTKMYPADDVLTHGQPAVHSQTAGARAAKEHR